MHSEKMCFHFNKKIETLSFYSSVMFVESIPDFFINSQSSVKSSVFLTCCLLNLGVKDRHFFATT